MKRIISILVALSMILSVPVMSIANGDITADAQAFVKGLKIMTGDPDGNFRGGDPLTRAEFVKVTVATKDNKFVPKNSISPYSDVPYTHWAAGYIDYATQEGLFSGLPDGSFEPERNVTYEELCKVFLIMIGYGSQSYGLNWETAQIDQARTLGLLKGSACTVGEYASRNDVAVILTNMLLTKPKDKADKYINTLGYKYLEDVLIVTDKNAPDGYVITSAGNFKKGILSDVSMKSGNMLVNSDDEIIMFSQSNYTEDYVIKASLPNELIAFSTGGDLTIEFDDDLATYTNSVKSVFGAEKPKLVTGDMITVFKTEAGQAKYLKVVKDAIIGPVTNRDGSFMSGLGITDPNPVILLDGKGVGADSIKNFDICYYVPQVNTVLAYSKRITGVYEDALPNKDNVTSIKLSGVTYKVGSKMAFTKLSSDSISLGDTITILFDKDGNIGDIMSTDAAETTAGYILSAGTKETTNPNGETGSSYYISTLLMDGNTVDYYTNKSYKDSVGYVKMITLANGKAEVNNLKSTNQVSGTFDWDQKQLGSLTVSNDVKIIDTCKYDNTRKNNRAITVFPQRLDGTQLEADDILYISKDKSGKISEIALKDVTGDLYQYGMILKSTKGTYGINTVGVYDVNVAGNIFTISGNSIFNVATAQPAQFDMEDAAVARGMKKITQLNEVVKSIDSKYVYTDKNKYPLAEKAAVYKKLPSNTPEYEIVPISHLTGTEKLTAYYDKQIPQGGRIRIIIMN